MSFWTRREKELLGIWGLEWRKAEKNRKEGFA